MSAEPTARRLHLFTALVLVAVFAAGAATGAGIAWALRPPPPAGPIRPPFAEGMPPFVPELGLSPEQQARVRAIVEAHRAEMEATVRETFPRVRAIQDRVESEIRAVLTPEQAARLDDLRSRRPHARGPGAHRGPGAPPAPGARPPGPGPDGAPPGPPPFPPPGPASEAPPREPPPH